MRTHTMKCFEPLESIIVPCTSALHERISYLDLQSIQQAERHAGAISRESSRHNLASVCCCRSHKPACPSASPHIRLSVGFSRTFDIVKLEEHCNSSGTGKTGIHFFRERSRVRIFKQWIVQYRYRQRFRFCQYSSNSCI